MGHVLLSALGGMEAPNKSEGEFAPPSSNSSDGQIKAKQRPVNTPNVFTNLIQSWIALTHSLPLLWALAPPLCAKLTGFLLLLGARMKTARRDGLPILPRRLPNVARSLTCSYLCSCSSQAPKEEEREENGAETAAGG